LLQGLVVFLREPGRRQLAQFVINERKQFASGIGVAVLSSIQNLGCFTHSCLTKPRVGGEWMWRTENVSDLSDLSGAI
jgi:hypothetical protein